MSQQPKVSIVLRSYNEERWIPSCLEAIFSQDYPNYEVILVDNNSTDKSVEKAKQFDVAIYNIEKFMPGEALNIGIRNSDGKYFVCLSAHCIPTNEKWLTNLVKEIEAGDAEKLAAVYGKQEPMSFTPATDKRDLLTVFGLDRKVQYKDSFFHNANSIVRRSMWDEVPFDEKATNIEDRIWAREMIKRGRHIIYTPEASVYHHHGIHQNQNEKRCANVVRIIEGLNKEDGDSGYTHLNPESLNVVALIPVIGEVLKIGNKPLLEFTIEQAKLSKSIKEIYVLTDSIEHKEIAIKAGAKVPFLRESSLSKDFVDLEHVYSWSLKKLEELGILPDIVIPLEITFPFREKGLIDKMVSLLLESGSDSVMPVRAEYSPCWKKKDGEFQELDYGFTPRKFKEPLYISVKGLGSASHVAVIREEKIIGNNLEMYEVNDPRSFIEVRDKVGLSFAETLLKGQ